MIIPKKLNIVIKIHVIRLINKKKILKFLEYKMKNQRENKKIIIKNNGKNEEEEIIEENEEDNEYKEANSN